MDGRRIGAHRFAWLSRHGSASIPAGHVVRHACDVPACCNPAHLELGTQGDNMRDKKERGRAPSGERNGRSKLTSGDVISLRSEYADGATLKQLGVKYGVSAVNAGRIVNRQKWRHL